MKTTLRILILCSFHLISLGQSIFYEDIKFEDDSKPHFSHSLIDTSTSEIAEHDGNSHLRLDSKPHFISFNGNYIYYVGAGYGGKNFSEGFVICLDELGHAKWTYKVKSSGNKHYYLAEMSFINNELQLYLFYDEKALPVSVFDGKWSNAKLEIRKINITTGELLSSDSYNEESFEIIYPNNNKFKFLPEEYLELEFGADSILLKQFSWPTGSEEVLEYYFDSKEGVPNGHYAIFTEKGVLYYRMFLNSDDNTDIYMYFMEYGSNEFIEYVLYEYPLVRDKYRIKIENEVFQIYTTVLVDGLYERINTIHAVNANGQYVKIGNNNLVSCYDKHKIVYNSHLDTWIYVGSQLIPNTLDVYQVHKDGEMVLLTTLDVKQFDHLINPQHMYSNESGDLILTASQTRYPKYEFLSDEFEFPVFLELSNEQLGIEVDVEEVLHSDYSDPLIYPNPVINELRFSISSDAQPIQITNQLGQLIFKGSITNDDTVETTYWSRGIYFVHFLDQNVTKTFVK